MKKKEIVIVILVLAFGIIYNISESDSLKDLIKIQWGSKTLRDKDHPVSFPQEQYRINADAMDVKALKIDNPAGIIEVKKSNDGSILIEPEIRIFHSDKSQAEKLLKNYKVNIEKTDGGSLRVTCSAVGGTALRRARFIIVCHIPEDLQLRLINAMGDISLNDAGKNVYINQNHGELFVKNIQSNVTAKCSHSDVRIYDVSELVELNATHSPAKVRNTPILKLNCSHSKVIINAVSQRLHIQRAYYSTLEIEEANNVAIPKCKHTKISMTNIKNGVTIKRNSHAPIHLTQIEGDVYVTGSNCPIHLENISADKLTVGNRHNKTTLVAIKAKTLNTETEHGDISLDLLPGTETVNITAEYGSVSVNYPKSLDPAFNLRANKGKIENHTQNTFNITDQAADYLLEKAGDTPKITVKTTFGSIELSNDLKPATVKAETETFEDTKNTPETENVEPKSEPETQPDVKEEDKKEEDKKEDQQEDKDENKSDTPK